MDTIDAETARNLLPTWRMHRAEITAKLDDGIRRLEGIIAADGFRWFDGVPWGTRFNIQTADGEWGLYELNGGGDFSVGLIKITNGGNRKVAMSLHYDEILQVERAL